MYTNVKLLFAVWYEPNHDPCIDAGIPGHVAFAQKMPSASYLGQAPRIRDWNEFKKMIERFEKGELVTESRLSAQATATNKTVAQKGRGCLVLCGFILFAVISLFALAVKAAWK
jgi:hypothetical protein